MYIQMCLYNIYKLYTVFTDTQYLYGCVVIAHGYCIALHCTWLLYCTWLLLLYMHLFIICSPCSMY